MNLPRRFDTIIKKKEAFLEEARSKLQNTALRLQTNLFEKVISEIIPKLDASNGDILDTANNYRLISELDRVYDTFNSKVVNTILPQITKGTDFLANLTKDYFTLSVGMVAKFDKIIEGAKVITDLKLGVRAGKMIRGGYLSSVLNTESALTELKGLLSKAVTSGMNMKEFISVIKDNVNGTEIKAGVFDRQLQRFAYDTYQQYDASYNKKLSEEFDMKYFIYQGGKVKDSRDFCVCHDGKVWSKEEAETWKDWVPSDCEYPAGYEVKAKNLDETPSYMGYPGYDPLVDRGGYNCRHILAYIPDELAWKLRPDLKK